MSESFFIVLLSLTLIKATPIVYGAICGTLNERSGVINIGIEGMMLIGAMVAFLGSVFFFDLLGQPEDVESLRVLALVGGTLAAMVAGMLIAGLHAVLSIHYKIDQIISGTAINLLAVGLTNYVANVYIDPSHLAGIGTFPDIRIPLLADIPIVGPIFFEHQPLVYLMLIMVFVLHYLLFNTPWGLRTRAVGEHPRAAETVGINVLRVRYTNVILSGAVAGLGGAFLVVESVGRFQKLMTTGRGFIALAAMIFGKWTTIGALGSALLFGLADGLGTQLQFPKVNQLETLTFFVGVGVVIWGLAWVIGKLTRRETDTRPLWISIVVLAVGLATVGYALVTDFPAVTIPIQFLGLPPYVLTILVLAGFVGRATAPAAIGQPYEKQ